MRLKSINNLLLIAVGILIAILMAEVTLQLSGYYYMPIKLKMLGREDEISGLKGDWRQFHSQEDKFFVFDPYIIWRPKKNFPPFNSQGFRGPEVNPKKQKGDYYIFCMGDSNTLGPPDQSGWVEYLGELIKEKHRNICVINAGVWGYTSFQCLRRLKKDILQYKPDLLLISCCANDALRVSIPDKDYVANKRFLSSSFSHLRICQFFVSLQDKLLLMKSKKSLLSPRVSLKDYGNYLNQMITLVNKNGTKVVLLTRPFFDFSPRDSELLWRNFTPSYNKLTMMASTKRGVLLAIDLYSHFEGKKDYFGDEAHFNEKGNRLVAEIVYNAIKNYLLNLNKPLM